MAPENNVQEILKSLTKLETSLEQLDSARKQVEDVVDAAARINSSLGEYVQSLNAVTDAVKDFASTANEAHKKLAEETCDRMQQLSGKLDAAIDTFKQLAPSNEKNAEPTATAYEQSAAPDVAKELNDIVAERLAILPEFKDSIDKLRNSIEGINNIAPNQPDGSGTDYNDIISQLSAISGKMEMVSTQINNMAMRLPSSHATAPSADNRNTQHYSDEAAAVRQELSEFEEKLNLIAKDVMVMRNSTHSILKNMETQLIDRSSKEGRASLIIATGALVAFVVVLLRLFGAI